MKNNEVICALRDMKRQIEVEEWTIPSNDNGSGSAGVSFIRDTSAIDEYLHFAETGDNENIPQCHDIYYISADDFDDEDNEVIDEMLEYADFVDKEEILGLVVCEEYYDMEYTFYLAHIKG